MENDYQKKIEYYQNGNGHLLIPTPKIEGLTPFHRVIFEEVQLTPEDVYKGSKDNYFRLLGKALERLANCAGIQWHLELTRIASIDSNYVLAEAVGGIKKPDGSIAYMKASYDMDLITEKEDLYDTYRAKRNDKYNKGKSDADFESYVEFCVNRDFRQIRSHRTALAETGAKNRVIRKLLNLKSEYSAQELSIPFVAVRIVFVPDMNDPNVKERLLDGYMRTSVGIYGGSTQSLPSPIRTIRPQEKIIDIPPDDQDDQPGSQELSEAEKIEIMVQEFTEMERFNQEFEVERLIDEKRYDRAKLKGPVNKISDQNLIAFYNHLIKM